MHGDGSEVEDDNGDEENAGEVLLEADERTFDAPSLSCCSI